MLHAAAFFARSIWAIVCLHYCSSFRSAAFFSGKKWWTIYFELEIICSVEISLCFQGHRHKERFGAIIIRIRQAFESLVWLKRRECRVPTLSWIMNNARRDLRCNLRLMVFRRHFLGGNVFLRSTRLCYLADPLPLAEANSVRTDFNF